MDVRQLVARSLADHGVDTMFGLIGDANMAYATAFVESHGGRFLGAAHESVGVSMADGYHRMSNKVGVASVTRGPGLTNTLTALTEASRHRSRVLLITGDFGTDPTHIQAFDTAAFAAAAGAGYERVYKTGSVVRDINRAFQRVQGEQRPLVLEVPFDLLWQQAEATQQRLHLPPVGARMGFDDDSVDRALGLIANANRPLILAGDGAVKAGARDELLALAKILDAPLATSLLAKDFFVGHPLNVGLCGNLASRVGIELISEADCVVAFGASLNAYTAAHGDLFAGKRVVQCDVDASRFGSYTSVDEALVGDAKLVAAEMSRLLVEAGFEGRGWAERYKAELASCQPSDEYVDMGTETTVDVRSAAVALDEVLPRERTVVSDLGRFTTAAWKYVHVSSPEHFMHSGAFGSIGLGLGTALGAAVARPSQLTVAMLGDGGFMMHASDFNTAVRNRLPLLVVVFNDGSYGSEHNIMKTHGIDPRHSLVGWPELAPLAEAMGGQAMIVRSVQDLQAVGGKLADLRGPLLVDVKIDPEIDIRA